MSDTRAQATEHFLNKSLRTYQINRPAVNHTTILVRQSGDEFDFLLRQYGPAKLIVALYSDSTPMELTPV